MTMLANSILLSTKNPCIFYPENACFSRVSLIFTKKEHLDAD